MKIESSNITMSAKSTSIETNTKDESLKTWTGNERPNFEGQKPPSSLLDKLKADILQLSEDAKAYMAEKHAAAEGVNSTQPSEMDISGKDSQKMLILQAMIEALTGKKIKFHTPEKIKTDSKPIDVDGRLRRIGNSKTRPQAQQQSQPQQKQGWGLEYDRHESHYEKQTMSFESKGVIKTSDGREINFSTELNMSREFASREDVSVRAGDAVQQVDPLVINFDGKAPELTDAKFSFDIDSNGTKDQISFVAPGSGFLALDLNNDGAVNNGKELFGPNTGNGFSELAQYDKDGNNWIDENDAIYDKLRIWTKDENGQDKLFALGEKGVGAIYLGNVDTSFAMKDSSNNLQGQIQKTGIFVKESGAVGTIQHIDLTI